MFVSDLLLCLQGTGGGRASGAWSGDEEKKIQQQGKMCPAVINTYCQLLNPLIIPQEFLIAIIFLHHEEIILSSAMCLNFSLV